MNDLELRNFTIGNNRAMTLMGGVNVLESRDLAMQVAEKFKSTSDELGINYIFKGSFDKANRSSVSSFRGPGLDEGLKILQEVSTEFNVAVVTSCNIFRPSSRPGPLKDDTELRLALSNEPLKI
jgi:2-dehydro-3-deoxyphosphooctonate aldolase (KDO 8-P synthase)